MAVEWKPTLLIEVLDPLVQGTRGLEAQTVVMLRDWLGRHARIEHDLRAELRLMVRHVSCPTAERLWKFSPAWSC